VNLKLAIITILALSCLYGSAQITNEGELWTGAGVKFNISKRFRLETDYQYRTNFSPFQKKQSFGQIGLRFKVAKWFLIKPSYRLIRMPEFNADRDRYALDFMFRGKYGDWRFKYRIRAQYYSAVNRVERGFMMRNKVTASYNMSKKLDPVLSWEMFSPIETGASHRVKAGLQWKINKDMSFNFFYALEKQMNRKFNDNTHIVGVSVCLTTGIKKKRGKKQ